MARLRTVGFEVGLGIQASHIDAYVGNGTPFLDTAVKRTGESSLHTQATAAGPTWEWLAIPFPAVAEAWARIYFRFNQVPASNFVLCKFADTSPGAIYLRNDGTIVQVDSVASDQLKGDYGPLSINTWYCLEIHVKIGAGSTDEVHARLDGFEFSAATGLNIQDTNIGFFVFGCDTGQDIIVQWDDFAVNDGSGSFQNSWPGPAGVYLLKPTSDSQRGSWTAGAGGTANLWDAVDNVPPVGVAVGTNASQIKSGDSSGNNATDEYRANLTTYDAAGIPSGDTIALVQSVVSHGEEAASGTKTGSVTVGANPVQAVADTFTFGDDVGAQGTWPTNWRTKWGTPQYSPSVSRSTAPRLHLRKTDAVLTVGHVAFAGLYVEASPPPSPRVEYVKAMDADRDWATPYQELEVVFDEAVDITPTPTVGDTIAGLTAKVNGGAAQALTYRSGNGTTTWKVRLALLVQNDDGITLDYDTGAGAMLAVDDNSEVAPFTNRMVFNLTTARVRQVLRKADASLVVSETVKYAVLSHSGGVPTGDDWMARESWGEATTDAAGVLDVPATSGVGDSVYLAVIRPELGPEESVIWTATVV